MSDNTRTNEHDLRRDAMSFAVTLSTSPNAAAPTTDRVLEISAALLCFLKVPPVKP